MKGCDMCQRIKNRIEIINREVEAKQGSGRTIDIFDSRLYYKVTISSWKIYDFSSLWQIV